MMYTCDLDRGKNHVGLLQDGRHDVHLGPGQGENHVGLLQNDRHDEHLGPGQGANHVGLLQDGRHDVQQGPGQGETHVNKSASRVYVYTRQRWSSTTFSFLLTLHV
jgi:hypothetical protein